MSSHQRRVITACWTVLAALLLYACDLSSNPANSPTSTPIAGNRSALAVTPNTVGQVRPRPNQAPPLPASTQDLRAISPAPPAQPAQSNSSQPVVVIPTITPSTTPFLVSLAIDDLYFVDALHGWLLGNTSDNNNHWSPEMRATTDGGRTWQKIAAPDAIVGRAEEKGTAKYVDHVRFLTKTDGWVFGPSLFSTHDGGKTWTEENVGGEIVALEPKDGTVWAIGRLCPSNQQSQCMSLTTVLRLDLNAHTWQPLAAQPLTDYAGATLVRTSAKDAWIHSFGDVLYDEPNRLVVTHDGGKSWEELLLPVPYCGGIGTGIAALPNGEVWYRCLGQAAVGSEAKLLYLSHDGGAHWELVAGAGFWSHQPKVPNNLQWSAFLDGFTASAPDHVWALYGGNITGASESKDGGRTWHWSSAECSQYGSIYFVDANHGWIGGNNSVSRTTDGGATWEHYTFYPPHETAGAAGG